MKGVRGNPDGSVGDLCVDVSEVTVADYDACVGAAACTRTTQGNAWEDSHELYPIDWVSPDDGNAYCGHLGRRLPTRAEWQWVAQNGPVFTIYPWGNTIPLSSDQPARVCALGVVDGCATESFPSGNTSTGVADLAGSVAEMVQDGTSVCVAGGSFNITDADVTNGALQNGSCDPFVQASADIGFRCVAPAL
jgi:formylglycine-generating enzyme required for sulfatase activity